MTAGRQNKTRHCPNEVCGIIGIGNSYCLMDVCICFTYPSTGKPPRQLAAFPSSLSQPNQRRPHQTLCLLLRAWKIISQRRGL